MIAAAIQWVDLRAEVDPITGEAGRDPQGVGIPDADAAALEMALALAERWGSDVLAVTAGPPAAEQALREALAAGATRTVRIDLPDDTPQAEIADGHRRRSSSGRGGRLLRGGRTRSGQRGHAGVPRPPAGRGPGAWAWSRSNRVPSVRSPPSGGSTADGASACGLVAPGVLSVEGAAARLRRASLAGEIAARSADIDVRIGRVHRRHRPIPVTLQDAALPAPGPGRCRRPRAPRRRQRIGALVAPVVDRRPGRTRAARPGRGRRPAARRPAPVG